MKFRPGDWIDIFDPNSKTPVEIWATYTSRNGSSFRVYNSSRHAKSSLNGKSGILYLLDMDLKEWVEVFNSLDKELPKCIHGGNTGRRYSGGRRWAFSGRDSIQVSVCDTCRNISKKAFEASL